MAKQKYYVVWKGRKTGIFNTWVECEKQVKGFVGAQYKAFENEVEAEAAYLANYDDYKGKPATSGKWKTASKPPLLPSVCVDAACSGAPGKLEYRGVNTETGEEIFHAGPYADGTNNVGEFLAIVHGLTWQAKHNVHLPIYSDSENAILWVTNGVCKTKLKHTPKNAVLFAIIHSAENWLAENELPEDKLINGIPNYGAKIPRILGASKKVDAENFRLVLVAGTFAGCGYSFSFFYVVQYPNCIFSLQAR